MGWLCFMASVVAQTVDDDSLLKRLNADDPNLPKVGLQGADELVVGMQECLVYRWVV